MRNTLRTGPNVRRRSSKRTTPNEHIGRTLPPPQKGGARQNLQKPEVRELKPSERVGNQSGQRTGKRQKPERSGNREATESETVRNREATSG